MEDTDIERLEQSNPILQVAKELGMKIRGHMAPCFRRDRHGDTEAPTLFLDVAKNRFLCKVCADVSGGVIDLVCRCRGWDRQQAIDWLQHRTAFDLQTQELYYRKRTRK